MIRPGLPAPKLSEAAASGTLSLLACIVLSVLLMVADHRGQLAPGLRSTLSTLVEPLWQVVALPAKLFDWGSGRLVRQQALVQENFSLRRELQLRDAQLARMTAVAHENQRLRELLGGKSDYRLAVRMAGIVAVDLDPWRQRVRLDRGSADGVELGQAVIDAGGMLGQVVEVSRHGATALLLTDASHAVPAQLVRTGLRLVVVGSGRSDQLRVHHLPRSADVQVGDLLVTSGIGGRFPAGFAVGRIESVGPDESGLFLMAEVVPAARIDRGREVLLVMRGEIDPGVGPPEAASLPVSPASVATPPASAADHAP